MAAGHQHQAVAVGCCACRDLGADVARRTGLVVDHELLAEAHRQALRHLSRRHVGCAAGDERHDDAHRLVGIFRLGRPRRQEASRHREEERDVSLRLDAGVFQSDFPDRELVFQIGAELLGRG